MLQLLFFSSDYPSFKHWLRVQLATRFDLPLQMKYQLQSQLAQALATLGYPQPDTAAIHLDRTRQASHGDFASNVAMTMAKQAKRSPRDIAADIVAALPSNELIERCEIAGPGFINFYLQANAYHDVLRQVRANKNYGHGELGKNKRVLIEFVSANPTGPLHVGHGRGAAYGDALARIMSAAGYAVETEYYVNDAGRQMDILTVSVWLRYAQGLVSDLAFPSNGYQGDYIRDIAATYSCPISVEHAQINSLFDDLSEDPERSIDELIQRLKELLGNENYAACHRLVGDAIVNEIRDDLHNFGIDFTRWFSEASLIADDAVNTALATMQKNDAVYEQDGALWFRSTAYDDEKDRVLRRANGSDTYFAPDIAYHYDKGKRGYDHLINIFGADHHGYIKRLRGAYAALGFDPEQLEILLVQFAVLYRGKEKVSMSTRGGDFVTLQELYEEVGKDAARFFYAMRKSDQHMDFDLELAKTQSADNPVYYVQYAHARVCSIFRKIAEKDITIDLANADLTLLDQSSELDIMRTLARFPEVVEAAALAREPHQVAYFLRDCAAEFQRYYSANPLISSEPNIRDARLVLIDAVRIVIARGLKLLAVSAPEKM